MNITPQIREKFTPTGNLRASINFGNPILANHDPVTGRPVGVSVDLAASFARLMDVDLELVEFNSAGKSVLAITDEKADIGFFAVDPLRGKKISFTAPYILIEGSYLVRDSFGIYSNEEVDRSEHRIVVGKGSAYDLFLTREIKHAQIVRAPTSPTVINTFLEQNLEIAAGVRQQLEADSDRHHGLRILPGRFMVIQQAMGTPRSRGREASAVLRQYVEEMKKSGFVAEALRRHSIQGASVAPAE